jgi:hypothetical protein
MLPYRVHKKRDKKMSLQKYRIDVSNTQGDGAAIWRTEWMGGKPLAKIVNCRLINLAGDMRTTVYTQGEPDTWFSIPAKFILFGKTLNAYVTADDDGNLVCHHCYY